MCRDIKKGSSHHRWSPCVCAYFEYIFICTTCSYSSCVLCRPHTRKLSGISTIRVDLTYKLDFWMIIPTNLRETSFAAFLSLN